MSQVHDSGPTSSDREDSPQGLHRHHQRTGSGQFTASLPSTYVGTDSTHLSRRSSVFFEVGLGGDDPIVDAKIRRTSRPRQVRFRSKVDIHEADPTQYSEEDFDGSVTRPQPQSAPSFFPTLPRLMFLVCIFLLGLQSWNNAGLFTAGVSPIGAKAGVIKPKAERGVASLPARAEKRADSPTMVCVRWSGQSAVVNGTLYYYGGRSSQSHGQTENTWNNDFVSLDLTKTWEISSPSLTGLAQPSGPPAVANGYLWNSYDALFLYGGEFSDSPVTSPLPYSTWEYDIGASSWKEYTSPTNSPGTNAESGNTAVQRAAEGAGVTVPSLGRGYYFGGHQDGYTTEGWSQSIYRIYLTSLLEYTFPGYTNNQIQGNSVADSGGEYRNITTGGLQDTAGFPERADGVLVYVPGYGKQGIILGLAGGNNESFTQLNTIDIYDIATSSWYKQSTSGPTPPIRVNPCAVAVSAADGSSVEVYMYGGQNLIPYGSQTQYSDVWILTIPSFTWIEVDTSSQSVPPARAGHTCNIWNSQMVVVGGYVGESLECDAPGIYVFNTSSLSWQNQYVALEGGNVLNNQKAQENDPSALQGSYGYAVPQKVQSLIGGNEQGAATVTSPALTAAQGPLATGKPITYTVTSANGAVATETAVSGSNGNGSGGSGSGSGSSNNGDGGGGGSNTGAIIAGVIAGCLALLCIYLAFCAWIYRRQLQLYKNHVSMAQRAQLAGDSRYIGPVGALGKSSNENSSMSNSLRNSDERGEAGSAGRGSSRPVPRVPRAGYVGLASNNPYRNGSARSSTEDLLAGQEPSYLGVLLNPRRSLRVVNRD